MRIRVARARRRLHENRGPFAPCGGGHIARRIGWWRGPGGQNRPANVRDKLRILRIVDVERSAEAGISGFMMSSTAGMERQGHTVTLWFRDQLMPQIRSRRRLFIPIAILAKVLQAVMAGEDFDIVEIHEPLAGPYALVARIGKCAGLPPCVVLSHGLEERGWKAQLEHIRAQGRVIPLKTRLLVPLTLIPRVRLGLCNADAVLVLSSVDRDYLRARLGGAAERISCCFGGVSEAMFAVKRSVTDEVRILFIGSWLERKGTTELMAAWRRLATDRANVRLTLAGVRDTRLTHSDVGDAPRVEVIPIVRREDLPGLLAEHDVFVLPSWYEGMPLSMLEAAASALPCVVCAVCGNLDVFRPEDPQRDGAILIPHTDSSALHRALLTLVDDTELRVTLGARARERARQFTWTRCADQTLTAYAAAVARRS